MFVFKDVEKCLNDNGFKIVRKTRNNTWNTPADWDIVFEHPILQNGVFVVGTFDDYRLVTIDGVQYIKSLKFANKVNYNQTNLNLSCHSWQRTTHEYFLFLLKWQIKKLKKQIDDCISQMVFLQKRSKEEEVTSKLSDVNKDFQ